MPFIKKKEQDETSWVNYCSHPEHLPPGMIVLSPGLHIWMCPKCGKETPVHVSGHFLSASKVEMSC